MKTMNISHLPNNLRKFFRILEKLIIKKEKLKSHITFNKTCILNKLMPKYVNFRLHDRTAQNEDKTHNFKTKLIIRQIKMQEKYLLHIQNNIDEEMIKLMEISSSNEYQNIMTTLNNIRIIRK